MWISKKRWIALVKRVADLEVQVQSQQEDYTVNLITFLPNELHSRTQVSFQLPSPDWLILEQSKEWTDFAKLLEEHQSLSNYR